jgi:hypothetical protein
LEKQGKNKNNRERPLTQSDFETVLKAATKPVKKESGEKEPAKT